MNSPSFVSRWLIAVAAAALSGCSSQGGLTSGPNGSSTNNECTAAGGQCVIGNVICAVPGSQNCPNGGGATPAGIYCCLSEVADCGQPSATTTACPSSSGGGAFCKGSPYPPFGAPNYEALVEAGDEDAYYPIGCTVTFPACNSGHAPTCTCSAQGSPTWSCVY